MLSFGLILGLSLEGGWTAEPLRPFRTDVPPVLDGRLDDPVWRTAPQETGFITYYPDFGAAMSEPTWVWYAYDRENLYFAFQCRDSRPDQIKTSVSARDKIRQDDWICINLDTYNDQQAIYALYVNPAGIQMDSRATSNSEDIGIDLVWYSEARVDSLGYSVEMKIPLKSLRFPRRNPVEMAVIFERHISRRSEAGTYPPLDPAKGNNFLIQTRPLLYQDIAFHNLFEILPAVTYTNNRTVDQGRWISEDNRGEASLTAKYGITSDFILDAAINPDFSQVESDAGQIDFNQRYALYYTEKRPFFLEGRDHFVFGASNEDDPLSMVLHTRTIADPLVGFRLTGKFGKRHSLDAMYALDELPGDLGQGEYAHVAVLRYKRALRSDGFLADL